jgi:predicted MFS family arabinose efflux permease
MANSNRLGLFVLLLGILLLGLTDVQIIAPILSKLAQDFSVTTAVMGTAVSAYALVAAVWALLVGPLSDRKGRLIFLRAAAFIFAGAALLASFAARFEHYVAARMLAGLAGGTISACVISQIADLFEYSARGRAMGWLGAVYFIAPVMAVPLGAWMAAAWGWRSLYLVLALAGGVLGVLIRPALVTTERSAPASSAIEILAQQFKKYPRYFTNRNTLGGLLLAITVSATIAGLITYLGAWLSKTFGMSLNMIGAVFMATGGASVLGALTGGWLADKTGKRRVIIFGSFLLAFILANVNLVQNSTSVFLFCAAGGLAMALREGPFQALISQLAPASERGAYIALRNATSQLAIAATALFCGLLFEHIGFHGVAYFAAACSLAAGALAWWIKEPRSDA